MLLEFAESGCPIFRATTRLSRGKLKSKGHGKLSIHFGATQQTIETIFRITVSANQLSLYGAVAEMCEEFETHQDRSEEPDVLMGQSIVLSEIKAEVLLEKTSHHTRIFHAVACREYTLPREDGSSQPTGWTQGDTEIGRVLEVTTSCLHGKHGVKIRIWSLSGDNTHS